MRVSPLAPILALAFLCALSSPALAEKILTITSEPVGAVVEINGQKAGVTPYQENIKEFWFNGPKYLWSQFLNTPLQLTVSKEGYVPQTITITAGPYRWVNANYTVEKIFYIIKQTSFHVVLQKAGTEANLSAAGQIPVTISSEPPGAEISVDGRFDSSTPSKLMLTPGTHTITVTRPGFKPWQRVISVEAGSEKSFNALLESGDPNAHPPSEPYAQAASAPSPNDSGQKLELVVGTGHSTGVYALAFSPDGKILASGDLDGVIKLWDGRSGAALRTLTEKGFLSGGDSEVNSLAFSPDGKIVASLTLMQSPAKENSFKWQTEIIMWDVASGKPVGALQNLDGKFLTIAFSNDGTILAGGRGDNPFTMQESESGVTLWEVKSGRELAKLPAASDVNVLMFPPNGTQLLAGNWNTGLKLWELPGGTAKDMNGVPLFNSAGIGSSLVDLNPYTKRFAAATGTTQNAVNILDSSNMTLLKVLNSDGEGWITSVKFNQSGRVLACASSEGGIRLWDTESWTELSAIKRAESAGAIAMSPNSKVIAYGSDGGKVIKLWNISDETTMKVLGGDAGHSKEITSLGFSPDSRTLASGSDDKTAKLWDVESGRVKTLTGHTTSVQAVAFSPGGKILATIADSDASENEHPDNTIRLWDVASGSALKTITSTSPPLSITFSPDGMMLAVGNSDKTISLFDVASGRVIRTLTGLVGEVNSVIFVNGETLQSFDTDDADVAEFKLWNVSSGELLNTFNEKTKDPNAAVFLGNMGGGLAVSEKLYAYPLPGGGLDLLSKSPTQMIDFSQQNEIAKLYLFGDNDWIITTPEGLFDGSPGAWKHAHWNFNGNTFDNSPLELYFNEFFYPNLLQEVIAGKTPKPPAGRELEKVDRRQPSVLIAEINGQSNPGPDARPGSAPRTDKRMAAVTLTVADNLDAPKQPNQEASSGAQDLRLFRNGSLIHIWRGDLFTLGSKDGCEQLAAAKQGEPRRVRCRAEVPVVTGDNQFTAYAFNREKVKSEDSLFPVDGEASLKRDRTLYVLAVGVGEYENPQFNLSYTAKDAQDFGAEVRRQQEQIGFYQKVEVIPLLDQGARKDFILSALKTLAEAVQPEDGLIIYFSGHGVAQGDRFYLIPSDIGYKGPRTRIDGAAMQTILAHSISDLELESAFTDIDAGRILLVIDACNSGKALQAEDWRRGPMDTKGLGQLAYEKGMYVLTASQDAELAYESAALKHSYLTYALVEEALKAKVRDADTDADGQVFLREWLDYAKRRVPRMRQEQVVQNSSLKNKSLEEVEVVEHGLVQRPRVFYRREPELQPFVVARPGGEIRKN